MRFITYTNRANTHTDTLYVPLFFSPDTAFLSQILTLSHTHYQTKRVYGNADILSHLDP